MNQYTYEQIQDMVGEYQDHGHYISCLCPWHDDNKPSLLVFADGWCRCLACGKTGSWATLAKALRGWVPPVEVKEKVSWTPPAPTKDDPQSMCISAHQMLNNNLESLGWYLETRGVLGRVMPNRIGWRAGWYTLPIYDRDGMFEGYVLRASSHIQAATGQRFTMPKHQPAFMYCPDWKLYEESDHLFIPFGMFDALTFAELRLPSVTTTAGMLSFNPDWLNDYRKRIYVVPDKGEEKAARDLVDKLGWRARLLLLKYPEGLKDPADFIHMKNNKREQLLNQLTQI